MSAEQGSAWPGLLKDLDSIHPGIGVWKNAGQALSGEGDVDYLAPRWCWPQIAAVFASWAETQGFEHLPPCLHRPWAMYLIAVDPERGRLMQLDVRESLILGRAVILDAEDVATLLQDSPLGFKTLRPGAEATLKLLSKCIDGRGRLDAARLVEESVPAGLDADLEGARSMAHLLHRGGATAERLVMSIASGNPGRSAARQLMGQLALGAFSSPGALVALARYRWRRRSCPVLRRILQHGQRLPPDLERWIDEARLGHDTTAHDPGRGRGMYLMLVGPDGVGKTTLRQTLTRSLAEEHRVWSGRLSGPFTGSRRRRAEPGRTRAGAGRWWIPSWVKVLYLYLDAWSRWMTWTRRWIEGGGWVVTERGWWDIAVYPERYRVRRVGRLHRALGALPPHPDLILVLETDPGTVLARKDELSPDEIRRQAELWRSVLPRHQPRLYLDASEPVDTLTELALAAIERAPASSRVVAGSW
ncbi:MAG TPA: hypothetical protein VG872_01115 [Acidimicrobiia bacterium]|nr:hypothetical protein [Acidimicrobiia bacterium]